MPYCEQLNPISRRHPAAFLAAPRWLWADDIVLLASDHRPAPSVGHIDWIDRRQRHLLFGPPMPSQSCDGGCLRVNARHHEAATAEQNRDSTKPRFHFRRRRKRARLVP